MSTISYEPRLRRLRISGPCSERDRAEVVEAIASSAAGEDTLTIDLTGATEIDASVATAIVEARDHAEDGRHITVLRHHDSVVDRQLRAAERQTTPHDHR